ncbi:MAG: PAS domain-containing protein [Candidatus Omnitrophota bacterium]
MAQGNDPEERKMQDIKRLQARIRELEVAQSVYKQEARSAKVFKSIADQADYGVAITDTEGTIIYFNKAYSKMHGYGQDEVIGKKLSILHTKEQMEDVKDTLGLLKEKGSYAAKEVWHKKKDGTVFPTLMNATVIKSEKGKSLFMTCTAMDMTETKKVQEELCKSEEKWRSVVESAPNIIIVADRQGTINFINRTVAGIKEEETIGKKLYDYIQDPEDVKTVKRCIEHVFETGEMTTYQIKGAGPNGATAWYETRIGPIKRDGKVFAVTQISTDITERKHAEKQLRESEIKFRLITENTSDFIAVLGFDGKYIYLSPSHKALGYQPEELIGKNGLDMIHPDDKKKLFPLAEKYAKMVLKTLAGKKIEELHEELEYRFPGKNGRWHHMEATANVIKGFSGKGYDILLISRDVTERKKADEALQKLRHAVNQSPSIVMITDPNSVIQYVNPKFTDITGYLPEEVVGTSAEELGEMAPGKKKEMWGTLNSGLEWHGDFVNKKKNGEIYYESAAISSIKDENGEIKYFVKVAEDITERKRADDILKESEEKFRTIFNNANDGILLADLESKKIYTGNSMISHMLGYNQEEMKNLSVSDIHPEESLPYVMDQFEKQVRKEIAVAKDIPMKRKDGSVFYADVNSKPMTLAGKTYLLGMFRDITERKEAARILLEQKELLDKINKELLAKIEELQKARGHIKRLEGLVPICARCKKIKVEGKEPGAPEAWVSLEKYISEKTEASLTHGLCPECAQELYKRKK